MSENVFYRFTPEGYYESKINAAIDPLETKKAGHTVYIQPCSATNVAPDEKAGFWPRWKDGVWSYVKLPETVDDLVAFGAIKHEQTTGFWRKLNELRNDLVSKAERYKANLKDGYWTVEKLPDPTPEEIRKQKEQEVRSKRDYLIAQTDFLVSGDYPISDADLVKVKAYRQALRDIPSQEGFPDNVVWPETPTYKVLRA